MLNLGKAFYESEFPKYDESKIVEDTVNIACSVNGKLRATFTTKIDTSKEELLAIAKEQENIKKYLDGHEIIKEIVVLNKIVNIVIK